MSIGWVDCLNSWGIGCAGAMGRASWQGGAALTLAWAACRAGPRMPSPARCWLWRLAYLKLLVALVWTTPVDLPLLPAPLPPAAGTANAPTAIPAAALWRQVTAARAPASGTPSPDAVSGLLLLWLLGVGGWMGHGIWEWRQVWLLRRAGAPVQDARVTFTCAALCRRLGLQPAPRLLAAPGRGSPLLLGVCRPVILLPASLLTGCSTSELRLMLAHELSHLRRRDLLWGWLPALAQGVFWFHPLVWLAGREWYLAQELACDAMAVRVTHAAPGQYGEMLLKVAAQCRSCASGGWVAAGVLESYQTLQRRLMAMKSMGLVSRRGTALIGATLAVLAVVGLVPWRVTAQAAAHEKAGAESVDRSSRTPLEQEGEAMARLSQLGIALRMYAQDYDELLPPMQSPAVVKKVLYPYVRKNDAVFLDPRTNRPFLPNASLSGTRIGAIWRSSPRPGSRRPRWIITRAQIAQPWEVIALYEPTPAADGARNVLFVDGHVKYIPEGEWQRLKQLSHIR